MALTIRENGTQRTRETMGIEQIFHNQNSLEWETEVDEYTKLIHRNFIESFISYGFASNEQERVSASLQATCYMDLIEDYRLKKDVDPAMEPPLLDLYLFNLTFAALVRGVPDELLALRSASLIRDDLLRQKATKLIDQHFEREAIIMSDYSFCTTSTTVFSIGNQTVVNYRLNESSRMAH